MEAQRLLTATLRADPRGSAVVRVLAAALAAVDPAAAVRRFLICDGNRLEIGEQTYDLSRLRRVLLVGAGKAAYPMAEAAIDVLAGRVSAGLLITKDGHAPALDLPGGVRVREAGHPVPDARGQAAAYELAALLDSAGPEDLVIALISGGGSALLPAPAPAITLADLQSVTADLLACGADIVQINTLRKHLDLLKGGGLARRAAPATLAALVLSDVIGDPLDVIASGPSVPDPTTFGEALKVLDTFDLRRRAPAAVIERLQAGAAGSLPETPKPGDPLFARVQTVVIGSNPLAARAAQQQARLEGWTPLLLTTCLQGEARQAGRFLASIARQIETSGDPLPRPACLLCGGETTVTLHGDGQGGRNQELALAAVRDLAGLPASLLVALASDGSDGPTDAAGAVVSGETLARAAALGLSPESFLSRNDAYHFFAPLGDLLLPGPTRTNVNDLTFIFLS